jgi:hypothetical protein
MITREEVERSKRIEEITHPVLSVLEYNEPKIMELQKGYTSIRDQNECQIYIDKNFGFLAEALEEAEGFPVDPLSLISIWSKATKIFDRYHRYRLASMISTAYAVHNKNDMKGLSRYSLENKKFPEHIEKDVDSLRAIKSSLQDIKLSKDQIDSYFNGQALYEMNTKQKLFSDEFLDELRENISGGIYSISGTLMTCFLELGIDDY